VPEQVTVSMSDIAESAEEGLLALAVGTRRGQLSAESPLWMFASSTRIKPKPVHIGGSVSVTSDLLPSLTVVIRLAPPEASLGPAGDSSLVYPDRR